MTGRKSARSSPRRKRGRGSKGSFDASQPAAHDIAAPAASFSLSAADSYADRRSPAQVDSEKEEKGAVEGGELGVVEDSVSTDSVGSVGVSDQVDVVHEVRSGVSGGPHHTTVLERICTLSSCTHCCQCHILHPRNGYGRCMQRAGVPYAGCACQGRCPPGKCAQRECTSRLVLGDAPLPAGDSHSPASDSDEEEHKTPPRRVSSRPVSSPSRLDFEQAQALELERIEREHAASLAAAAAVASAAAPAVAAFARASLPTLAAVASHSSLHNAIPYADHVAWTERCAPVLEQYRQASATNDPDSMASALIEVLQLPGKYLYRQRIHTHERRMLNRQQLHGGEWQMERLSSRLRR